MKFVLFFFKQKTAYEMRISDWSSDVCSSDLLGWVKDARISRRLPDTLVVDIVERDPVAVWQHDGQLHLIDVTGVVLQSVSAGAMPDLPLVVGPNANLQTAGLNKLMENEIGRAHV